MLRPCRGCLRLVRPNAPSCPFCGAALGRAPEVERTFGRVARLVSIGAAIGAAACGESAPPAKNAVDLPVVDAGVPDVAPHATASATATAPPDEFDDPRYRKQYRHGSCTPDGKCPPYGGPPPRGELV